MSLGPKAIVFASVVACARALAAEPTIVHAGLECIAPGRFAVVLSNIDPETEIQTAKVYFRSDLYPDFYWVTMKHEAGRFVGILPQAAPETPRVIYYLEAITHSFEGVRSEEFDPVVGDCDDNLALAYLAGNTPEIVIGATKAGAAALPPGFAAAGIVGTIAATGIASSVGAGVGTGVVIAGAAGAAGAAAAAVVVAQGQGSTSTVVAAAPPSSSATTSAPAGGGSSSTSSTTTIVPGPTTSSSSTTTTVLGGTTTVPGGSSSTTTTVSGVSTTTSVVDPTTTSTSSSSTTTASITTTTTTASSLDASCFKINLKGPCQVTVEAKCVQKPVDRYDWVLDTQNTFLRIDIPNGKDKEDYKWSDTECDQSQNITFRLTVFRGSVSSTAEKTVLVPSNLQVMQASEPLEFVMETRIELASSDNSARGRILIDGRVTASLLDGQPSSVRTLLSPGVHELEGVVVRSPGAPGLWSFDFRGTQAFETSSVQVMQGNVLTIGPGMITIRLGGEPEEHLRLRFTLDR